MDNYKETLINFYHKLKEIQPSIDELMSAGHDEETANSLYSMFNIELKNEEFQEGNDLFNSFFENFDLNGFSPSNQSYRKMYKETDEYDVFADGDLSFIVRDKKSGIIKEIDFHDGSVNSVLAPTFEAFLHVILIEVEYDKVGYLNLPFTEKMRIDYKIKLDAVLSI